MVRNNWRASLAFLHDVCAAAIAWTGLYWLRFNLDLHQPLVTDMWRTLAWVLPLQAAIFLAFGLYRGLWRFASLPDLQRILLAAGLGAVAAALGSSGFDGRVLVEPGRAIVGEAVELACTVRAVKHLSDGTRCVVVDAGGGKLVLYVDGAKAGEQAFAGKLGSINDVNCWLGRSQYAAEGASPVDPDFALPGEPPVIVRADLLEPGPAVRHAADKLGPILCDLATRRAEWV